MEKWTIKTAALALANQTHILKLGENPNVKTVYKLFPDFKKGFILNKILFGTEHYLIRSDRYLYCKENLPSDDYEVILLSEIQPDETEFENGQKVAVSDSGQTDWRDAWFIGMTKSGRFVCETENGGIHYWEYCRESLVAPKPALATSSSPATITITTTYPVEIVVNGKCLEIRK